MKLLLKTIIRNLNLRISTPTSLRVSNRIKLLLFLLILALLLLFSSCRCKQYSVVDTKIVTDTITITETVKLPPDTIAIKHTEDLDSINSEIAALLDSLESINKGNINNLNLIYKSRINNLKQDSIIRDLKERLKESREIEFDKQQYIYQLSQTLEPIKKETFWSKLLDYLKTTSYIMSILTIIYFILKLIKNAKFTS